MATSSDTCLICGHPAHPELRCTTTKRRFDGSHWTVTPTSGGLDTSFVRRMREKYRQYLPPGAKPEDDPGSGWTVERCDCPGMPEPDVVTEVAAEKTSCMCSHPESDHPDKGPCRHADMDARNPGMGKKCGCGGFHSRFDSEAWLKGGGLPRYDQGD